MAKGQDAMDVGYEMADLLLAWRHGMSHEDVADAIMYALQRYSWDARSPGWIGLSGCLFMLQEKIRCRLTGRTH